MPGVALPGSSNNVSPIWLCISPYKTKASTENIGGGQPRSIFVRYRDGTITAYESVKGCAKNIGLPSDTVYAHLNKVWIKNNVMGVQFADNIETFNSYDIIMPTIKEGSNKTKKVVQKRKSCKKPQRKYKLIARYNDGRIINCYSAADASRKTGVHKRTVLKYIDRKWDSNNKYGLQFVTISKEA